MIPFEMNDRIRLLMDDVLLGDVADVARDKLLQIIQKPWVSLVPDELLQQFEVSRTPNGIIIPGRNWNTSPTDVEDEVRGWYCWEDFGFGLYGHEDIRHDFATVGISMDIASGNLRDWTRLER